MFTVNKDWGVVENLINIGVALIVGIARKV